MIIKKTPEQIEAMARAGQALAEVFGVLEPLVSPGLRLTDLNKRADKEIRRRGGIPSFLGYRGYPASICTSVNESVVHGIPDDRRLKDGDILSLDIGLSIDGWHADRARTFPIGKVSTQARRLIEVTSAALDSQIEACRSGASFVDLGSAVEKVVLDGGFSVVREYGGHQIGREMHEGGIQVPNHGGGHGPRLEPGMVFALEPMVNVGDWHTKVLDDRWTVVSLDGSLSAHFEDTVAVTADGPRILTRLA